VPGPAGLQHHRLAQMTSKSDEHGYTGIPDKKGKKGGDIACPYRSSKKKRLRSGNKKEHRSSPGNSERLKGEKRHQLRENGKKSS